MKADEYSIAELKEYLKGVELTEELLEQLSRDSRLGVQKLAKKYYRLWQREKEKKERWEKMAREEKLLRQQGYHLIAGIDEAGRGPLAGPVVAAAVILNEEEEIIGLDDSKRLSEAEREELFQEINAKARAIGVGIIDNETIDRVNILQATFLAMHKAINSLEMQPEILLIDGNRQLPDTRIPQETIIDGDSRVNAIAAASIIAKVTRDRLLDEYDRKYPAYGFAKNKGYGTQEHIQALKKYGPTPLHRFSFSLVNKYHFLNFQERLKQAKTKTELEKIALEIKENPLFLEEQLQQLRSLYKEKKRSLVYTA